ncbi:MAG TPA: response regulator transcription factor [Solirubrobacter sp.]|nr:response regulator transcription factor [Solirubrobacter sp.]
MSTTSLPIVLVDDQAMVVLGLRTLFHHAPEVDVVGYAGSADEALEICREVKPRVVVVDAALGGSQLESLELCRRLELGLPRLASVIYTAEEDAQLAQRAFAAGAKAVVSKSEDPAELVRAVLLAARGKTYVSPTIPAAAAGERPELSPKQLEVLRLVARGFERRQIAEDLGIGDETVKSHLAALRRRLGARTSAHAVALGLVNSLIEFQPK